MSFSDAYRAWMNAPLLAQLQVIEAQLTEIDGRLTKMADVLDTVLADMATLTTDMTTLLADAQTLITDFQATAGGMISVTDARWAQLETALTGAATNASQLDTSIKAVLPAAPAPATPPPAGA